MFMDSSGSSQSTSHESGTSASGTSASGTSSTPPTGDGVLNPMTAFLDSVRETVRDEMCWKLPPPASEPQATAHAMGTPASALFQEANAGRLLVSC